MFQELIKIFKQVMPDNKLNYSKVNENSKLFNDICPNSSALVMVAFAIENKYHISLPGYLEIRKATVGDVIKMIQEELSKTKHA
jgi:acyl carrier protein